MVAKRPAKRLEEPREIWGLRARFMRSLFSAADPKELAQLRERGRAQRDQLRALPSATIAPETPLRKDAEVLGAKGIKVRTARDPARRRSLGGTGRFVRVEADTPFAEATLRFGVRDKAFAHLDPGTMRVARWDEQARRFRVVAASGFDSENRCAFARITRSGVYTAVGMPRDPRAGAMIELARAVRRIPGLATKPGFARRMCQAITCNPDAFGTGSASYKPDSPGSFGPGGICGACLDSGPLEVWVEPDLPDVGGGGSVVVTQWENRGPDNVPGRITALAVHPANGDIVYAGSADGGVFKTIDGGQHWQALWSDQESLAIGAVAIAPSAPDVVYAATGEWGLWPAGVLTIPGTGVYRSDNAGVTWQRLTPIASLYTTALAVDPTNPDRVWVAGDRGVQQSRDGGATWGAPAQWNYLDLRPATSVSIDPDHPDDVWIGVDGEIAGGAYRGTDGPTRGGVYRSEDGGNTWMPIGTLPWRSLDDVAPLIARGRDGVVAVKMGERVFTNADDRAVFVERGAAGRISYYGNDTQIYCGAVAVDPENEQVLLAGAITPWRIASGEATWTEVRGIAGARLVIHADIQALSFDPTNSQRVYAATDGGVFLSTDNGETWSARSQGLVTTQCYSLGVSRTATLAVAITTQDNSCYRWSSGLAFEFILIWEGGWIEYDPQDERTIYATTWQERTRKSTSGGDRTSWQDLGINTFDWESHTKGLAISWRNRDRLLALRRGLNAVSVALSEDGGFTWVDPDPLAEPGEVVMAAKFAYSDDSLAFAASNTGRVWRSTDGGRAWQELPRGGLPVAPAHALEVDWHDPSRIWIAFGNAGVRQLWRGDVRVRPNGASVTWTDATGGLPDIAMTGIALDPDREGVVYASNMFGVFRTPDSGTTWEAVDYGLPNCVISELAIRPIDRTLWVSTFGRGVWRLQI